MAVETGAATGFIDLYEKLVAFATTALGAENWTQETTYERDDTTATPTPSLGTEEVADNKVILKGPGSGGDEIYVGLFTWYEATTGKHNIGVQGLTGFDVNKLYDDQVVFSGASFSYLWDQAMTYWFVGSGRRVIAVIQVGGVYQILYFGFFLPFATPTEYPYPNMVGGCGWDIEAKYSDTGVGNNAVFFNGNEGSSYLYGTNNTWITAGNTSRWGGFPDKEARQMYYLPWSAGADKVSIMSRLVKTLDDCYVLTPVELIANGELGFTGLVGALDGIFQVSGFNNYSGNVVTISNVDYICFQNVYDNSVGNFFAIRWE